MARLQHSMTVFPQFEFQICNKLGPAQNCVLVSFNFDFIIPFPDLNEGFAWKSLRRALRNPFRLTSFESLVICNESRNRVARL